MQNRRRHKRFAVDFIDLSGNIVFAKSVQIVDIAVGGVSLKADRRLNIGSEYTIKIESADRSLIVKGIVVWSRLSESTRDLKGNVVPVYKAGIKFTDVSEEKKKEIISFIEEYEADFLNKKSIYGIDDLRLYVRLPIEDSERAMLRCDDSYKVKKLSLGGMLIESECPVEIEDKLDMEIKFSDNRSVKFLGRVASCFSTSNETPVIYEAGIEFLEMTGKDRETLYEFIQMLENIDRIV